jgi:hypothetical protein
MLLFQEPFIGHSAFAECPTLGKARNKNAKKT